VICTTGRVGSASYAGVMANNGYVDPELFLHDEIKAFRATKSQN
jgi:hypothetical protein